jgi:hypothetical protein
MMSLTGVRQLKGTFLQGPLQAGLWSQSERVNREQLVMSNTRGLVYVVDDDVSVREGVASDVETNCELSELAK